MSKEKPIQITYDEQGNITDIDITKLTRTVKGSKGDQGNDGEVGATGSQGEAGHPGQKGERGDAGKQGKAGKNYSTEVERQVKINKKDLSSAANNQKTFTQDITNISDLISQHSQDEAVHVTEEQIKELIEQLNATLANTQTGGSGLRIKGGEFYPDRDIDMNDHSLNNVHQINYHPDARVDGSIEGQTGWDERDHTLTLSTGLGPVLQVGQELYVIVYNASGTDTPNGAVLNAVGIFGGRIAYDLAKADTFETIDAGLAVATMDIPEGTFGISTAFGVVRDIDTTSYVNSPILWISAENAGELTDIKPEFPDYPIQVGAVVKTGVTDGEIVVEIKGAPIDTIQNFFNGTFRETINFQVESDGTTILGILDVDNGHPDLTMMFSDGFSTFNVESDPSLGNNIIELTPGTDMVPVTNYIYILEETKELVVSTDSWPFDKQHIKIAEVFLQSASATQADGALRNQNWNDHIESTTTFQGHLSHMTERMRQNDCKWSTGTEGIMTTPTVGGGTSLDVFVTATSGTVYQLHRQIYPGQTMPTDDCHVVNNIDTPYERITNINTQTQSAASVEWPDGVTLINTSFSFVVWGVQNRTGAESHLMLNLPTNTYLINQPDSAVEDAKNYSVYTIPKAFQGVGFLIARFTMTLDNGGNWTLYATEDLRGRVPNTQAGGGSGGGGATSFLGLDDTPVTYVDKALNLVQVDPTENFLEYTSDVTLDSLTVIGNVSAATFNSGTLSGNNSGDQDLSGLVPYTGATANVDLGNNNLTTSQTVSAEQLTSTDQASIGNELEVGAVSGKIIIGDISGNARGSNAIDIQGTRFSASTIASGFNSMCFGNNNVAYGTAATSIGSYCQNYGSYSQSIGIGNYTKVGYYQQSVFGASNRATSGYASAFGYNNQAGGYYSSAFGSNNTASADNSSAFGRNVNNSTASSTEIGINAVTLDITSAGQFTMHGKLAVEEAVNIQKGLSVGDGSDANDTSVLVRIDNKMLSTTSFGLVNDINGDPALVSLLNSSFFRTGVDGTGSIDKAVAILVKSPQITSPGTIVNAFGIEIENQTAGTTSNFAIKTGTGNVEFGDDTSVTGTFTASSNIRSTSGYVQGKHKSSGGTAGLPAGYYITGQYYQWQIEDGLITYAYPL